MNLFWSLSLILLHFKRLLVPSNRGIFCDIFPCLLYSNRLDAQATAGSWVRWRWWPRDQRWSGAFSATRRTAVCGRRASSSWGSASTAGGRRWRSTRFCRRARSPACCSTRRRSGSSCGCRSSKRRSRSSWARSRHSPPAGRSRDSPHSPVRHASFALPFTSITGTWNNSSYLDHFFRLKFLLYYFSFFKVNLQDNES